jgi:hypothetical protein
LATKLVQAGYECVYPDAPHLLPPPPTNYSNEGAVDNDGGYNKKCSAAYNRVNARAWYMYSTDDPSDTSNSLDQTPLEYVGLQLSIDSLGKTLHQIMQQQQHPQYSSNHGEHKNDNNDKEHEICAIFGFSQGATMAHILSSVACSLSSFTTKHNNLKEEEKDTAASLSSLSLFAKMKIHCVILVSGFPSMHNVPTLSLLSSSSSPLSSSSNLHNGTNNNNNKVTIATETNNKQKKLISNHYMYMANKIQVYQIYIVKD